MCVFSKFNSVRPSRKLGAIDESDAFKVGKTNYRRGNSRFAVGKIIGGCLYVHKNYVPDEFKALYETCKKYLPAGFKYKCVFVMLNDAKKMRFDEAPDFDTAREPVVGKMITVDSVTRKVVKTSSSKQIWHHKWMWVGRNYKGFDVDKALAWSKRYTKKLHEIEEQPNGWAHIWEKQLAKVGLK